MSGPKCIVCGKPIRKKTTTYYVREATNEKPHGHRESSIGGTIFDLHFAAERMPKSRPEVQAVVNGTVIFHRYGAQGRIWTFTTWDGESYEDEFFHSKECAMKQGYASARSGHRYTWRSRS